MGIFAKAIDGEYKMVIVVRSDIKMSKGKTSAQVAHAAVNCALAAKKNDSGAFSRWYSQGQKKVVVKVDSLEALYELKVAADANKLTNSIITDAGRTEIPSGTVTCLGIGPCLESAADKITGELAML